MNILILIGLTIVLILPKPGLEPGCVDECTQEETEAIEAWEERTINFQTIQDEMDTWGVTGDYEDIINENRSPTILKGGVEYLLGTLMKGRVPGDLPTGQIISLFSQHDAQTGITADVRGWLETHGYTYPETGE